MTSTHKDSPLVGDGRGPTASVPAAAGEPKALSVSQAGVSEPASPAALTLEPGTRVVTLLERRALTHDGRLTWPVGERGTVESVTARDVRVLMDRDGYHMPYFHHEVAIVVAEPPA